MGNEIVSLAVANLHLRQEIETRKKVEKELKKSEERFRLLFENAQDGIYQCDAAGNFLMVNRKACSATGYSREELMTMNTRDVEVSLSEREILEIENGLGDGGSIRRAGLHRRKDGSTFPLRLR